MQTRLQTSWNLLQSIRREKNELCRSYRDHGETYVRFQELCDVQYRFHNAKLQYAKLYHGKNYEKLDQIIQNYRQRFNHLFTTNADQDSPAFDQAYRDLYQAERALLKCTDST